MNTHLYNEICRYLRETVKNTEWEGHIYAVGGCIRDEILGREIKDVDIAVDIPGGGVGFARWLHRRRHTLGRPIYFEKYGTAKLVLKRFPHDEIETVQTRAEKYTKATSRCPEVVAGTIEDDCYRRDFTVNTLYKNLATGEILDITGRGIPDIQEGILRTPMNPEITFDDDPVRILRCLRFAARFGWKIEPEVMTALNNNISRLSIVSKERHRTELGKMVAGNNPVGALTLLCETGAIEYMLPLLRELAKNKELWRDAVEAISRIPEEDLPLRFAALFHDIGKLRSRAVNKRGETVYNGHEIVGADMIRKALRSAKFEPMVYDEVFRLVRLHHFIDGMGKDGEDMTDRKLRQLQSECGNIDTLRRLMRLYDVINNDGASGSLTRRVLQRTSEMVAESKSGFSNDNTAETGDTKSEKSGRRRSRSRNRRPNRRRTHKKSHFAR